MGEYAVCARSKTRTVYKSFSNLTLTLPATQQIGTMHTQITCRDDPTMKQQVPTHLVKEQVQSRPAFSF